MAGIVGDQTEETEEMTEAARGVWIQGCILGLHSTQEPQHSPRKAVESRESFMADQEIRVDLGWNARFGNAIEAPG